AIAAEAAAPPGQDPNAIDFASPDGVIEIRDGLKPYHAPSGTQHPDNSGWYLITATNSSIRPAARVLQAAQPQSVSFRILPRRPPRATARPAGPDSLVGRENTRA